MHARSEFYTSEGLGIGGQSGDTRPQIPAWEDMMGGPWVGLEVVQLGGVMVGLDRNWGQGLDLVSRLVQESRRGRGWGERVAWGRGWGLHRGRK